MMYDGENKIESFEDLHAWQIGRKLVNEIYDISKQFPKDELYNLVSQMRRASISFISNIAEGFTRFTPKEKLRFYSIAKGSLIELKNQLYISLDQKYLSDKKFSELMYLSNNSDKLVQGLIKKMKEEVKKKSPYTS